MKKISAALKGHLSPHYGLKGEKSSNFGRTHSIETKLKMSVALGSTIYQYSLDLKLLQTFPSAVAAAKYFNHSLTVMRNYARTRKIFQDQYILSLEELSSNFVPQKPLNLTRSEEVKIKISKAMLGKSPTKEAKLKMSEAKGTIIYLYSLDFQLLDTFISSRVAAKYFNHSHTVMIKYARSGEIFQDKFVLSLEKLSSSSNSLSSSSNS